MDFYTTVWLIHLRYHNSVLLSNSTSWPTIRCWWRTLQTKYVHVNFKWWFRFLVTNIFESRIELRYSTYQYWRNKKILTKSLIGGAQEQESEKFSLPIFPCLILQPLSTWSYTGQTVLNYAKITDKSSAKLISFWTRTSTFERVFPRTKKLCISVLVLKAFFQLIATDWL